MRTHKRKFILFPRKVVTHVKDEICTKTGFRMLCFVNQVKFRCFDVKHTTYYSTKLKVS